MWLALHLLTQSNSAPSLKLHAATDAEHVYYFTFFHVSSSYKNVYFMFFKVENVCFFNSHAWNECRTPAEVTVPPLPAERLDVAAVGRAPVPDIDQPRRRTSSRGLFVASPPPDSVSYLSFLTVWVEVFKLCSTACRAYATSTKFVRPSVCNVGGL